MKKIVSLVLSLIMVLSIATVGFVSVSAAETQKDDAQLILGDADGDGDVSIIDVTVIQRWLAKMSVKNFNEAAADVDGDGAVTPIDALFIQRWLAEFEVPYAIGEPITADTGLALIAAKASSILGDANGDGSVQIDDVTVIQRYLAGMNVKNFDEKAADVDGNGEVESTDGVFIQRWLVEFPVPYAIGKEITELAKVGSAKDLILGDVNGDGEVTSEDAKLIQKYLVGIDVEGFDESTADVDGNGKISITDVTYIQIWLSGRNLPYAIGEKLGTKMVLIGDADGDGRVSILDVTTIQKYLAKMNVKSFNKDAADVDRNGEVESTDGIFIQRWLVEFPVSYKIGNYVPVKA